MSREAMGKGFRYRGTVLYAKTAPKPLPGETAPPSVTDRDRLTMLPVASYLAARNHSGAVELSMDDLRIPIHDWPYESRITPLQVLLIKSPSSFLSCSAFFDPTASLIAW